VELEDSDDLSVIDEDVEALGGQARAELGQGRVPTRQAVRGLSRIPKKTAAKGREFLINKVF
jgi:hypothetical protein